jgi:putative membrane protein
MKTTRMKIAGVAGVCMSLGCWSSLASSPVAAQAQHENTRRATYSDESFIRDAEESSVSQVDMAKLAEQKAEDPQVKKFAQNISEEHQKITEQLKELGQKERINAETSANRTDEVVIHRLQASSSTRFDKAYLDQVASELARETGEFEKGASSTNKPALKEFAQQTTPTLKSELQEARQLAARAH